jgi:signal transduction histidine kinase/CheY-like chemotaxis protein
MATGQPVADARFALHCDDGLRYCSVHAAPVPAGERQHARVVYAILDVTDQVRAERAREAALDEARRANIAKSHFLAKMSHEMRTPLNGVLGIAEVLARQLADAEQQRMIKLMHDSGSLLLSIINDLLDMSKIEADQLSIEVVPFDLLELAHRLEAVHTLRASEKHLSFSVQVHGQANGNRRGDPHRLLQILHNVISNAIKFTEQGSVGVEIDCSDRERIVVRVTDTGIGMTAEEQTHVFEDFGQADGSIARKYGGTGLGMAIVKRLVDMMDGRIEFTSQRGRGTTFVIDLPLPVSDPAKAASARCRGPAQLRPQRRAHPRRRRQPHQPHDPQRDAGPARRRVEDGRWRRRALEAFDRESFDAIILDISMPDIDGITVLDEIRARERARGLRRVPVLAFTANAMAAPDRKLHARGLRRLPDQAPAARTAAQRARRTGRPQDRKRQLASRRLGQQPAFRRPGVDGGDGLLGGLDVAEQVQVVRADGAGIGQRLPVDDPLPELAAEQQERDRAIRRVWISVSVSNSSSSVPNPPGKTVIASARIRKCILRIAK